MSLFITKLRKECDLLKFCMLIDQKFKNLNYEYDKKVKIMVEIINKSSIDIHKLNNDGKTILMIALSNNLFGCVKVLLRCSISPIGQGLLKMAVQSKNCGIIRDLIEDGVDYDSDVLKYISDINVLREVSKHKHFNVNAYFANDTLHGTRMINNAVANMDTEIFNFIIEQNCEIDDVVDGIINLYRKNTDKGNLFMKKSLIKLREYNKINYNTSYLLKIAYNLLFYKYDVPLQIFLSVCVNYAMAIHILENNKDSKEFEPTIKLLKTHMIKCQTQIATTKLYKPLITIIYEYTGADN